MDTPQRIHGRLFGPTGEKYGPERRTLNEGDCMHPRWCRANKGYYFPDNTIVDALDFDEPVDTIPRVGERVYICDDKAKGHENRDGMYVVKDAIEWGTRRTRETLAMWQRADKLVQSTLRTFLDIMQWNCKHEGAVRGYNERDGSWMNPCPTCEKSE